MSIDLSIEITFLSDWGTGTGTGRGGDVDRVIARDSTGLPFVPGKTLTGVLRNACEEAAHALDEGGPGVWHAWLRWLFGDQPDQKRVDGRPWPAALSIRPGVLGPGPQARARADRRFAQAAVLVRPGVEINSDTGVAKDDSLRMEERALRGLKTFSPASLNIDRLPREARVLLVAGARLVDRIGGKRRRGAGRCQVSVLHAGTTLTARAEDFEAPAQPPLPSTGQWESAAVDIDSPVSTYAFELTCLTPVVASAGVKGNTVQTLDYIPGYLLFPIVARALGGNVADLVSSGRIRVSDATPAPGGTRLLPAPLSLQKPKGVRSDSSHLHNALRGEPADGQRYVPVKQGWLDPAGALSVSSLHQQNLIERAHAVIEDQVQRPTEQSGGLFVQQGIPEGTVLRFEVDLPVEPNLAGRHSIGRSKKDDYGHVDIRPVDQAAAVPSDSKSSAVVAYVESDVLLHDESLTTTTSATELAHQVADALGVTFDGGLQAHHAVRRHETWSARWGLPRPSLVAVKAGTVIRFGTVGHVSNDVVHLGTRQAEGFGRVLINPAFLVSDETASPGTPERRPSRVEAEPGQESDDNSRVIAGSLSRRLLSDAVRGCDVTALVETFGLSKLSNSQLGVLRELLTVQTSAKTELRGDLARNRPPNAVLAELLNDPNKIRSFLEGRHDPISARRLLLIHCLRHARIASDRPDGVSA